MRHRKNIRRLSRSRGERLALVRNLTRSFLIHRHITTTAPRAREVRRMTERLLTLGKKGDLASFRAVASELGSGEMVRVVRDLAVKYRDRSGGYVRTVHLSPRKGDAARLVHLSLV